MATIRLTGKHAIGENEFTQVDDEDLAYLSCWRWKAKPNGSGTNVYAVRNAKVDGKYITIRMHREVLGLAQSDRRDVDHVNHRSLDNRRSNLRATTRSANILNARRCHVLAPCKRCGKPIDRVVSSVVSTGRLLCRSCTRGHVRTSRLVGIGPTPPGHGSL